LASAETNHALQTAIQKARFQNFHELSLPRRKGLAIDRLLGEGTVSRGVCRSVIGEAMGSLAPFCRVVRARKRAPAVAVQAPPLGRDRDGVLEGTPVYRDRSPLSHIRAWLTLGVFDERKGILSLLPLLRTPG
jgi:hypothetical protein